MIFDFIMILIVFIIGDLYVNISESSFSKKNSHKTLIFCSKFLTIGEKSFNYYTGIANIFLFSISLNSIGKFTFNDCSLITSFNFSLSSGILTFDEGVFSYLNSIVGVFIPNSVSEILAIHLNNVLNG